jgi:hypothetical protein
MPNIKAIRIPLVLRDIEEQLESCESRRSERLLAAKMGKEYVNKLIQKAVKLADESEELTRSSCRSEFKVNFK